MQHRHRNGGGLIQGDQAVVSALSFVSAESSVFHGARVGGRARLEGKSAVGGTAVVVDSHVTDSVIGKVLKAEESYRVDGRVMQPTFPFVCNAEISGLSKIENQLILGDPEDSVKIWNSHLEDAVEVRDSPRIAHAHLMHYACVCGDAQVLGTAERPLILDRRYHIHRGVWQVEPLYFEVGGAEDEEGVHVGITECEAGRVNIGCLCLKVAKLRRSLDSRCGAYRMAYAMGWRAYHLEQLQEGLERWESETN
jgi:hypothetical protein